MAKGGGGDVEAAGQVVAEGLAHEACRGYSLVKVRNSGINKKILHHEILIIERLKTN